MSDTMPVGELPGTPGGPDAAPGETGATPIDAGAKDRTRSVRTTWIAALVVGVLAGAVLFMAGLWLGRETALTAGTPEQLQTDFQPFWEAFNAIDQTYAGGPVDRHALVEGAIDGMFKAIGDPYSEYMNSDAYKRSLSGVSGEFEGIGATLTTRDPSGAEGCTPIGPACEAVVVQPLPGSPAEKAGLRAGDVLLKVNGAAVDGQTLDAVVGLVRGPRGTPVSLTLRRGSGDPIDLTVVRDVITNVDVSTRVLADGAVGYLRISGFDATVASDFTAQLKALVGARGIKRIVVDLRDDPGGLVDQARTIASQFIASGPIFWEETANGKQTQALAEPGGVATDPSIQVVVLINRGSASASEIVAGALQDTGRARLVGERSYGKGTIQEWLTLSGDSGGFRLTIAKWLTPKMRWIHNVGLTPDVAVDTTAAAPGTDPVLDRAVSLLTGPAADVGSPAGRNHAAGQARPPLRRAA